MLFHHAGKKRKEIASEIAGLQIKVTLLTLKAIVQRKHTVSTTAHIAVTQKDPRVFQQL